MKCPYCSEEIKDEAIKCRFCHEWLKKNKQNEKSDDYFLVNINPYVFIAACLAIGIIIGLIKFRTSLFDDFYSEKISPLINSARTPTRYPTSPPKQEVVVKVTVVQEQKQNNRIFIPPAEPIKKMDNSFCVNLYEQYYACMRDYEAKLMEYNNCMMKEALNPRDSDLRLPSLCYKPLGVCSRPACML